MKKKGVKRAKTNDSTPSAPISSSSSSSSSSQSKGGPKKAPAAKQKAKAKVQEFLEDFPLEPVGSLQDQKESWEKMVNLLTKVNFFPSVAETEETNRKMEIEAYRAALNNAFRVGNEANKEPEPKKSFISNLVMNRITNLCDTLYDTFEEEVVHACDGTLIVSDNREALPGSSVMGLMQALGLAAAIPPDFEEKMKIVSGKPADELPRACPQSSPISRLLQPEYYNPKGALADPTIIPEQRANFKYLYQVRAQLHQKQISPPEDFSFDRTIGAISVTDGYSDTKPLIYILDPATQKHTLVGPEFDESPEIVADGKRNLIWAAGDSKVEVIDIQGKFRSTMSIGPGGVEALFLGENHVFTAQKSGLVQYWDINKLDMQYDPKNPVAPEGPHGSFNLPFSTNKGIRVPTTNKFIFSREYHLTLFDVDNNVSEWNFLGHSGHIRDIHIDPTTPNYMLTCAGDVTAKLWDLRTREVGITMESRNHPFLAGAFAHFGGDQPNFCFLGGAGESIACWDLRMRMPLFELSTGNNIVKGLGWHSETNSLYAATFCTRLDRLGHNHEYDGPSIDDVRVSSEPKKPWPRTARHGRESFYVHYDATKHESLRYQFTENPNHEVHSGTPTKPMRGFGF